MVGGCLSNSRWKALQYKGFGKRGIGVLPKVILSRARRRVRDVGRIGASLHGVILQIGKPFAHARVLGVT